MAPWIGLAVAVVMLVVVASYRQNVHAYPSGGGDYEVATTNLGPTAGLTVASALLVDYVLTVAVSMSSAMSQHRVGAPVRRRSTRRCSRSAAIVLLTAMNLRGIRESGTAFAIPTYAFMVGMFIDAGLGLLPDPRPRDDRCSAESAGFDLHAEHGDIMGFALVLPGRAGVLLRLRRADRCRGDQQRRAGVPQAQVRATPPPRWLMLGVIAVTHVHGHHRAGQRRPA